jgi:hypothetical protein
LVRRLAQIQRSGRWIPPTAEWEFGPWQECLALLPIRIGTKTVAAGAGYAGSNLDAKVEARRAIPIDLDADAALLRRVHEALLELKGLEPEIRRPVLNALGRSQQDENHSAEVGRTAVYRWMVDVKVAEMRDRGERPRAGRRNAAIEAVAKAAGITPESLQRRFDRHR